MGEGGGVVKELWEGEVRVWWGAWCGVWLVAEQWVAQLSCMVSGAVDGGHAWQPPPYCHGVLPSAPAPSCGHCYW